MSQSIVHPRMLAALPQFYPSLCTIQADTSAVGGFHGHGEPTWTDAAGLIALPCCIAPLTRDTPTGTNEMERPQWNVTEATHHCALQGRYTGIESLTMRAVVDGIAYRICGPAEYDSQGIMTRLRLERTKALNTVNGEEE